MILGIYLPWLETCDSVLCLVSTRTCNNTIMPLVCIYTYVYHMLAKWLRHWTLSHEMVHLSPTVYAYFFIPGVACKQDFYPKCTHSPVCVNLAIHKVIVLYWSAVAPCSMYPGSMICIICWEGVGVSGVITFELVWR